jgi:hypothetical protein
MANIRKFVTIREQVTADRGAALATPIVRVAGLAVVSNPLSGTTADDLSPLFEIGRAIGTKFAPELVAQLGAPAVSYGKAALVGVAGEMEHGGACIHPMLGKPMREAIGGGQAVIASNVKIAAPGTPLDVPLGHKDNVWSFDHFDTMTIHLADAPLPDEIVIVLAFADGGRPSPRCGDGPV